MSGSLTVATGAAGSIGEDMAIGDDGEAGTRASAVQSVDRALLVLEILAEMGKGGVTEIAGELGVHKSTVSRLIAALESRGYVEQLSERGKYQLGVAVSRLARSRSGNQDLAKLGQDACNRLASDIGETATLAILEEDRAVNIVEATSTAEVALQTWVGRGCPAHATSSGKVLLSALSAEDMRTRLGSSLEGFTDNTITDLTRLRSELSTIRRAGWGSAREELEIGLNAVAAPVFDNTGQTVAALSVSGPAYRLKVTDFESVATQTVAAAGGISRFLGWTSRAN